MVDNEGLWYTQTHVTRKRIGVPSGSFAHVKPSWIKLEEFLRDLEKNHKNLFKEVHVGSGSVNNGESWGDFYELKISNRKEVTRLFNELQKEIPYDFYKELT